MQTAKQDVVKMLDGLPENTSYEDIQYHLYVLEKVKKGKARLETEAVFLKLKLRSDCKSGLSSNLVA